MIETRNGTRFLYMQKVKDAFTTPPCIAHSTQHDSSGSFKYLVCLLHTYYVPGFNAARIRPMLQFLVRVMSLPPSATTVRTNTKYSFPSKIPS